MEAPKSKLQRYLVIAAVLLVGGVALFGGAIADRFVNLKPLSQLFPQLNKLPSTQVLPPKQLLSEESVTININKNVSPSVVTVAIVEPARNVVQFDPFSGFTSEKQGGQQDIGTGFIVDPNGLIVTNKHVVSTTGVGYKIITKDNKEYEVKKIYRDPANDVALLKIDAVGLSAVNLGNSDQIQVGQYVAAIGTALGQFRQSITTGVVSGIGRSIEAGSSNPFEGYAEQLDNVIQTDAAINPGNSGGPLVNSSEQVIGINVAVAQGAQSVGFALPINVVKTSIDQFHQTGDFLRPFLGVEYQVIVRDVAIRNDFPEGAYVQNVVSNSAAAGAGIKRGDIITKLGGEKVTGNKTSLGQIVNKHKVGDKVDIEIWRDGKTLTLSTTLTESSQ
ncbi:MAG: trypsin-like peptidase domain-containing protein [Candidatus Blackburnbacteria bacterium]|nr:trypsin-like peptidase domain-containing protein [Candidatus Blackburnbacteria bacterium]